MAVVGVKVNGREYHLACDDGQEEHLRFLSDDVDDRVRALVQQMGPGTNETMGFLLAALTMADEIIENKKEIEKLNEEKRNLSSLIGSGMPTEEYYDPEAVAITLEEIAERIEKIAERVEMR